jgi:tetratricopeptide (TPR) repeat protein
MQFPSLSDQRIADSVEGWIELKKPDEALKEFQKFAPAVAESSEGLYLRFRIEHALGDTAAATETLTTALARFSDYKWPHVFLAAICARQGKEREAAIILAKPVLELDLWEQALHLARYTAIHHPEHAVGYYHAALKSAPNSAHESIKEVLSETPALAEALASYSAVNE